MQKKSFFIIEKLKNTESAQLCESGHEGSCMHMQSFNPLYDEGNHTAH